MAALSILSLALPLSQVWSSETTLFDYFTRGPSRGYPWWTKPSQSHQSQNFLVTWEFFLMPECMDSPLYNLVYDCECVDLLTCWIWCRWPALEKRLHLKMKWLWALKQACMNPVFLGINTMEPKFSFLFAIGIWTAGLFLFYAVATQP